MPDKPTEIVFNPYQDSCPFRQDNKCSPACAFFFNEDSINTLGIGMCSLSGGKVKGPTGYFYERVKQQYSSYI